ncbi:NAD-dependent epimerase/dehydratase family protein [Nocardia cyriacigeorgica]|uniref:NAD-dependent epimerase/dehydratase family protein n=1 Tax=Nocardia cyriacigeorgica TaxID=135487 RepID=UPI0002E2AD52|nr:NAD(P)-dependent oxidoreductase [Nocardia cyriacigeorgica]TLF54186.1 NAD(P)-dependent oxidoreductase [Nocardia cyriacigeorgica]
MKVIVAGATGTLGMALTEQLIAAGHAVTGLCRRPEGAQRLTAVGAEAVVADVMDEQGLLTALAGHTADAVIHQATALTRMPITHSRLDATNALRDIGTTHLLLAAETVGARRFLTQSFFLGYGYRDHGSEPVTEDHLFGRPDGTPFDRHLRSMRSNEDQVFAANGIDGIALRYGLFYGPEPGTRRFAALTRARRLPVPTRAGVTSPIHITDAAAATVAALEHGRGGEAYNIADDTPLGFDDYIRAIARASGAPEPRRIPGWLLRPTPYLHGLMVGTSIRLSNDKAKRELGWMPRYPSCHEGLVDLDADDHQLR